MRNVTTLKPCRVEFWRPLGRLGLNATAGGAVMCDCLQIAVATGPTYFYYQVEYLESYRMQWLAVIKQPLIEVAKIVLRSIPDDKGATAPAPEGKPILQATGRW